ncbi:MAG: MFS transporter [Dehalococcoidia bacterium]
MGKNRKRWIVLGILCLSLFIIAIDNMVLNLALPSISEDLGASASQLQWIINAYILVFASLLLTMGAIGDRFGRKRLLQVGLLLFGAGSLAAALSTSTEMLIACRAFLGIGGAMIMPSTLSILTDTFRDPQERAKAIAMWAAVFALGAAVGPVIGGYLLEHFNWSVVFYINLPVVTMALTGGYFFIRESRGEGAPKPDLPGVVLSIAGLFALVYGITKAGEESWTDSTVLICLGAASVVLGVFAWWESRSKNPMLPLAFLKNMSFTGASLAMVLTSFALMGSMFFMSQYLQSVQGYSPVASAVRMLPLAAAVFVTTIMSALVAERIGNKLAVGFGILIAGGGLLYLSLTLTAGSAYGVLVGGMVIMATGMGMTMSPATNAIQSSLPVSRAGIGSAMNDTTRQVGGALGVAVLGALMNATYLDKIDNVKIVDSLPEGAAEAVRSSIQGAHIAAGQLSADVSQTIVEKSNVAFTSGMTDAMFIGAIIMMVASVLTLIILPKRVQAPEEGRQLSDVSMGPLSTQDDSEGGSLSNAK